MKYHYEPEHKMFKILAKQKERKAKRAEMIASKARSTNNKSESVS